MKMLCTKKNLIAGLQTTSRVIGGVTSLPILNNLLLKTDQGRLRISGTNLEMAVNTWVAGKVEEEGEITIPAKLLSEYVYNLAADKVNLVSEKLTLKVEGEKTETHIKGLPAEEFPLIPDTGEKIFVRLDGGGLKKGLSEVSFAAAYSEAQPEISGILFRFSGKTLELAATDRYRLAETRVGLEAEVIEEKALIIPARAVGEIGRILGEGVVEVYLREGQVCFKNSDTEIITRLIEGQYPDYKQIIPAKFTTRAEFDRHALGQAIKAVSLFATYSNNIEFELLPGKDLIIAAASAQVGDSKIQVPGEIVGEKNKIIFNYRYLLDCLNTLSDERVVLQATNETTPVAMTPKGRDNFLYIVMPIKV